MQLAYIGVAKRFRRLSIESAPPGQGPCLPKRRVGPSASIVARRPPERLESGTVTVHPGIFGTNTKVVPRSKAGYTTSQPVECRNQMLVMSRLVRVPTGQSPVEPPTLHNTVWGTNALCCGPATGTWDISQKKPERNSVFLIECAIGEAPVNDKSPLSFPRINDDLPILRCILKTMRNPGFEVRYVRRIESGSSKRVWLKPTACQVWREIRFLS